MRLNRYSGFLLVLLSLMVKGQTTVIDSLQKIIALDKKDSLQLSAMINLANEYTRSNMNKAKEELDASIALAHSLNLDVLLSAAYGQMVTQQINTGKPDSATYFLGLLKQLAATHSASTIEANYNSTAGTFYRIQGDYKTALLYMKESLRIQTALLNNKTTVPDQAIIFRKTSIAGQTLNIGNNYLDMGDIKNALSYHLQALKLFEELNNKRGQSFCLQSVAQDLRSFNRYMEALPYIQKAMVLKTALNDKRGVATALALTGEIYLGLKDPDKALEYATKALQVNQELKIVPAEAKSYYSIGEIYAERKDIKTATDYFNKSKMLALQLKDSSLAANASARITGLGLSENKQKETEKKLFSSLQTSIEKGDRFTEISSYKYLSGFYANNGQYDKALGYSERYHAASDSVQNNDLQLQVKKLEQQYNLEKKEKEIVLKEKEIALLKKDKELRNTELQKERTIKAGAFILAGLLAVIGFLVVNRYRVIHKAKRMVEIEKLRNNIARDLHDDIGSALSSININSNMALNNAAETSVVKSQLEKIRKNSGNMMESMSDIVWAINPINDSMENLVMKMKEFAAEMLEPSNIHYTFKETGSLKNVKPDVHKRKEIYLIYKEAVNNAVKYSGCAQVSISVTGNGNEISLHITDDGKGFDTGKIRAGNGLRNMQERAAGMGGILRVDTATGKGTSVLLNIPVT